MIKLVIFDCDGVLVDSEPLANQVMAKHISDLGWEMDGAESMRHFKGLTMVQVSEKISSHLGRHISRDWLVRFETDLYAKFRKDLKPIDGVFDLIRRLANRNISTAIASQGSLEKMQVSLGATGLMPLFEGKVFSANMVARPKPAPDLFLKVAHSLSIAPEHTAVIEDSLTGIKAALAAKMTTIAYDAQQTLFTACGWICRKFQQVKTLLKTSMLS